jgi:DNA-binding transcriptional LysR family regulator
LFARHGAGLFQTYRFVVERDPREGSLVEVLPEYGGATRPFVLLYPHGRLPSAKVRCFVDFLLEQLAHRTTRS